MGGDNDGDVGGQSDCLRNDGDGGDDDDGGHSDCVMNAQAHGQSTRGSG